MKREGKYLNLSSGFKLYYEECGEGTPVVFLHGWNSSHEVFAEVIGHLRGCRYISYDCRGHGRSGAPSNGTTLDALAEDLEELLQHCQARQAILVGWSMGAATIWRYIRRYGCERLAHLVLIDMSPKVMNDDGWQLGLWQGNYRIENYMDDMSILFTDSSRFAAGCLWDRYQLKIPETVLKTQETSDIHVLTSLWHSMMVTDCREDLKKITVNTDIFYGDPGDKYCPKTAEYLAQNIPAKTTLVPFTGCGHDLMQQDGSRFLQEINRVIKNVQKADA